MEQTLARVFEGLEAASQARRALMDAGVSLDQISIRPLSDEAGAMDGNFVAGNGRDDASRSETDGTPGFAGSYEDNFQPGSALTLCVLEVQANDEQQHRQADELLQAARGISPVHG